MGRRPVRCRVLAYLRLARTHPHPGIFPEPARGPGRAALAMGSSGSPRHRRGSDLARSRVDLRRRPSRPPCPGSAKRGALPDGSRGHRRDSAQGLDACRRAAFESAPHRAAERSPRRPFLCFTDRDPEDIVASGFKVVGSAQRRRAGAILQHGSLLLEQSDRTPELLGVCDLAGVSQDPRFWSGLVQEKIARALELQPVACDLPAAVSRRAAELEEKVYRVAAWTGRR